MNGRTAKKLRRYVRQHELALSERAFQEFKLWTKQLPWTHRLAVAWKVLTRALVLLLVLQGAAHAQLSVTEMDRLQVVIIQAESSGDPNATGRDGERGLMQISRHTWESLTRVPWRYAYDPTLNVEVGHLVLNRIDRFYGKDATRARIAYTYNTGDYLYGPIPGWALEHPNNIYRRLFNEHQKKK